MKTLNLKQGSAEWLAMRSSKFTASEAPAMMGNSKYQSRNELLAQKATGEEKPVTKATQRIFDKGHAAEEAARPLVEEIIGEELYPIVGLHDEYDWLLASFDGITLCEDVIFEHKLWNEKLVDQILMCDLEPHYFWQLEQQLLVSGAEKVIFVCSDGTRERFEYMEYESVPERRDRLIAGWLQFQQDLANFDLNSGTQPPPVEAEAIRDLPAIHYQMNGLALTSDLEVFKKAAQTLVEKSKLPIETDQDFATAEAMVKTFKAAEDNIKGLVSRVLGEVSSIDSFTKDLKFIGEQIRQARLATDKQVKTRKDEIRRDILNNAQVALSNKRQALSVEINAQLPEPTVSILAALKNKRTVESLQNAADTALSQALVELDMQANLAKLNQATLNQNQAHAFLFHDWPLIAFKSQEDFNALVSARITEHEAKKAEQEKIAAQQAAQQAQARQIKAEEDKRRQASAQQASQPIEDAPTILSEPAYTPSEREYNEFVNAPSDINGSNQIVAKMVTVDATEFERLQQRDQLLTALEACGVEKLKCYEKAQSLVAQNV